MNETQIFKLYACCHLVSGSTRSIIYDLQRKECEFIPNILAEIIEKFDGIKSISEIKQFYESEYDDTIDEYFSFLVNHEFIFFLAGSENYRFPKIDLSFRQPGVLSQVTIVVDTLFDERSQVILAEITELGCRDIQLIYLTATCFSKIASDLEHFSQSAFNSIEIISGYDPTLHRDEVIKLVQESHRISCWLIHSAPITERVREQHFGMQEIIYSEKVYDAYARPEFTNAAGFKLNIESFTESHHKNAFYNGRICIDKKGELKTALFNQELFGNITENPIRKLLEDPRIELLWNSKKDNTAICKECEFRYMCQDNRLPLKIDEAETWAHQVPCHYNPYTAEWANEEKCIDLVLKTSPPRTPPDTELPK